MAYIAGCYVTLHDLRSDCQVQHLSLESRKRALSCLAISDDASFLAAGERGPDPSVIIWPLDNGRAGNPIELRGHRDTITAISFAPNGHLSHYFTFSCSCGAGKYLATVGNVQDGQLILWDCQSETVLFAQHMRIQANLTSLSFSMDSKVLYTSGKSHFTVCPFLLNIFSEIGMCRCGVLVKKLEKVEQAYLGYLCHQNLLWRVQRKSQMWWM